jgi:hypothetical protein
MMTAVKNNGLSLACLPRELRNPYICYAACEQNSEAIEDIPANTEFTEIIYMRAKEQEIREHEYRRRVEKQAIKELEYRRYRDKQLLTYPEIYSREYEELLAREEARIDAEMEKRRPAALKYREESKALEKKLAENPHLFDWPDHWPNRPPFL